MGFVLCNNDLDFVGVAKAKEPRMCHKVYKSNFIRVGLLQLDKESRFLSMSNGIFKYELEKSINSSV